MDIFLPLGVKRPCMGINGYTHAQHQEHHDYTGNPQTHRRNRRVQRTLEVIETLAPEKLTTLRRIATIESVGSSTRIEGAKLSDAEVEKLLSGLHSKSFSSRDEEEVAGYADAMDMIFEGHEAMASTENHIKQLHGVLLKYSSKDQSHRGEYKTVTNHVEAFGPDGKSLGVVFETATPFETPEWMKDIVDWFNRSVEEESHQVSGMSKPQSRAVMHQVKSARLVSGPVLR
jgi:Fic family protein